jgi:hypothetical protein
MLKRPGSSESDRSEPNIADLGSKLEPGETLQRKTAFDWPEEIWEMAQSQ